MIRIYLFTYKADADEALVCVRCAQAALADAVITVVDDGADPVPPAARSALEQAGAQYRQTSWPRNGNLRGPECVRGIISTLGGEAKEEDVIIKIDSDTLLLSGGWVTAMQHNGLALHASGVQTPRQPLDRPFYGPCYALSGQAAKLASAKLAEASLPPLAPEDITICQAVTEVCGRERIRLEEPWSRHNQAGRWTAWNWFSHGATPEKYAPFSVVTFGNPLPLHINKTARPRAMDALFRYRFYRHGRNCTKN